MEIIKRKSGIKYREKLTINGKSITSPSFDRKHDCKQWLFEQKALKQKSLAHGTAFKFHVKITLEEYAKIWLESKKAQGVANSSYRNYECYLNKHILKYFVNCNLKNISKSDIEKFQIQLLDNHNPKGVNLIIAAFKNLFNEAIKDGYILKNPCEHLKPVSSDKVHDVFWTKAEIDQFLKVNYYHALHDFFLVAINTGMRRGELAGLCWDRVNFVENTIAVTRTRDRFELKQRTKTNITRVVPMNGITRATLLNLFNNNKFGSNYVFYDSDGKPIDVHHVYRQFISAQKKAGMKNLIRFHDLRHTFASQFIMNKGNIYDLQKLLGHTDISMTTRYAHHSMEHLQNAIANFSLGSARCEAQNELAQNQPTVHLFKSRSEEVVGFFTFKSWKQ